MAKSSVSGSRPKATGTATRSLSKGSSTTQVEKWIYEDLARRKVVNHPDSPWHEIDMWGLARWGNISRMVREGRLICSERRGVVWYTPTEETWLNNVKPLVDRIESGDLLIKDFSLAPVIRFSR